MESNLPSKDATLYIPVASTVDGLEFKTIVNYEARGLGSKIQYLASIDSSIPYGKNKAFNFFYKYKCTRLSFPISLTYFSCHESHDMRLVLLGKPSII
jgi:hypothetical protein